MHTPRRLGALLALLALVAAVTVVAAPAPAEASPTQARCGNTAATPTLTVDRPTLGAAKTAVVTVSGTGYLLPPHVCGTDVFGGIYLFFGWVQPGGQWGPSHKSSTSTQGLFGTTYSYPGEGGGAETRDDGTGTIRLVSFTAGGESGTSTPFHMDGAGNWRADLTVRGATYRYTDLRTGASSSVDCRVVQCGVFTIGAHGKASRTNEVFTPITFVDDTGAPIVPSAPSSAAAGGVSGAGSPGAGGPVTAGSPTVPDPEVPAATSPGSATTSTSTPDGTTTTEPDGDDPDAEQADELDAEQAAAVQDFAGSSGGGGAPVLWVLVVAVLAALVAAGVVGVRRRSRRAAAS